MTTCTAERLTARFVYEYDLNVPCRHEIRLEECLEAIFERNDPFCVHGHKPCPPEDCGGPSNYLTQREAWHSIDALDDLGVMAEIIDRAMIEGRREPLDDADTRSHLEEVLERTGEPERWKGRPFPRRRVNAGLQQDRHLVPMHQQH